MWKPKPKPEPKPKPKEWIALVSEHPAFHAFVVATMVLIAVITYFTKAHLDGSKATAAVHASGSMGASSLIKTVMAHIESDAKKEQDDFKARLDKESLFFVRFQDKKEEDAYALYERDMGVNEIPTFLAVTLPRIMVAIEVACIAVLGLNFLQQGRNGDYNPQIPLGSVSAFQLASPVILVAPMLLLQRLF